MTTKRELPEPYSADDLRKMLIDGGANLALARARVDNWVEVMAGRVRAAVALGVSESEAAKLAGVTRMTVRSWLGK